MPLDFSAALRRMRFVAGVVAVIAAMLAATGILVAMGDKTKAASESRAAPTRVERDPIAEANAARLLDEADLAGEFSFVLYDTVRDRYLLRHRPDATHFSQSIVKLLIAVSELRHGADEEAVTQMLARSDDWIASQLWGGNDGPAVIEEQAEAMGLQYTEPASKWIRWGDTLISASDVVRVYEYLLEELPERERAVIFQALEDMTDRGADGFDQTFGLPSAADDREWAVKQGWGCCKPDRFLVSTGTVGPDRRYIAAIFGAWDENEVGESEAAREMTTLAEAALALVPAPG